MDFRNLSLANINIRTLPLSFVSLGLQLFYDPATYTGSGTLNDLSGNNYTGTLSNLDTSHYLDHYFTYSGNGSLYSPDLTSSFNTTTALSVELWLNPNAPGCAMTERGDQGWYDNQIEVSGTGPAQAYCGVWNGGYVEQFNPPGPFVSYGSWYQITFTYDTVQGIGYINGNAGSPVAFTRSVPWQNGNNYRLDFGNSCGTAMTVSTAWQGKLGIARVYNRALSAQEIVQNYNATRGLYGV